MTTFECFVLAVGMVIGALAWVAISRQVALDKARAEIAEWRAKHEVMVDAYHDQLTGRLECMRKYDEEINRRQTERS